MLEVISKSDFQVGARHASPLPPVFLKYRLPITISQAKQAMLHLEMMLTQRTHRDLELIARAHGLPFTRRVPKADGLRQLAQLLQTGVYMKAFKSLTSAHYAALQALVVGGGWLPLPLFTHHFGTIRPYKPWRTAYSHLTPKFSLNPTPSPSRPHPNPSPEGEGLMNTVVPTPPLYEVEKGQGGADKIQRGQGGEDAVKKHLF
jgi:hypothetical protein